MGDLEKAVLILSGLKEAGKLNPVDEPFLDQLQDLIQQHQSDGGEGTVSDGDE
jgi:hypothetical protein